MQAARELAGPARRVGARSRACASATCCCPARLRARARARSPTARRCASGCSRASACSRRGARRSRWRRTEAVPPDPVLRPRRRRCAACSSRSRPTGFRVSSSTTAAAPRRCAVLDAARRASSPSCACTRFAPSNGGKGAALQDGFALGRRARLHARAPARRRRPARRRPRCRASSRRCARIPTRSSSASRSSTRARRARGSGRASSRAARSGSRRSRSRSAIRCAACAAIPLGRGAARDARGRRRHAHGVRPEFAVRCVFEGIPIRNVPVRVVYVPGGLSHFDVGRDFPVMGATYLRLWLGMLRRAPALLAGAGARRERRRGRRGRSKSERGNRGWLRFALWLYRKLRPLGRRAAPGADQLVLHRARRSDSPGSSRDWLRDGLGHARRAARRCAGEPGWSTIYRARLRVRVQRARPACPVGGRRQLVPDRPRGRRARCSSSRGRAAARSCSARTSAASTCCACRGQYGLA